jgi:hypothetical protein
MTRRSRSGPPKHTKARIIPPGLLATVPKTIALRVDMHDCGAVVQKLTRVLGTKRDDRQDMEIAELPAM